MTERTIHDFTKPPHVIQRLRNSIDKQYGMLPVSNGHWKTEAKRDRILDEIYRLSKLIK